MRQRFKKDETRKGAGCRGETKSPTDHDGLHWSYSLCACAVLRWAE
jgi:hypothetical protein